MRSSPLRVNARLCHNLAVLLWARSDYRDESEYPSLSHRRCDGGIEDTGKFLQVTGEIISEPRAYNRVYTGTNRIYV